MRAHGGVDAAWTSQTAVGHRVHHLFVQGLAHAVQTLELVLAGVVRGRLGDFINGGQRMCVVGSKLRVHRLRRCQKLACAGDVGDVCMRFARVDREVAQAIDLCALDFAVPISAFDEADHQAAPASLRQRNDFVDDRRAALLVGLNYKAQPVPVFQCLFMAEAFEQLQRELQPFGLFRIDVQANVVLACQRGQ